MSLISILLTLLGDAKPVVVSSWFVKKTKVCSHKRPLIKNLFNRLNQHGAGTEFG